MLDQRSFFQKYRISEKDFRKTKLRWPLLESIHADYLKVRPTLEPHASFIAACLQRLGSVHSIKFRLKDPEHLIEKIIRRKLENPDLTVTLDNYRNVISDLIGIRALHLFKEDWEPIHDSISKTWQFKDKPVANVREGDSKTIIDVFKKKGCQIKKHPFGYRSIHYIVLFSPSKEQLLAEIQVRTIFEEGWSEIDHRIRYPYDRYDPILAQFVVIFNRLAGSADEMGSFIKFLKEQLLAREEEHKKAITQKTQLIKNLKHKLTSLKIQKSQRKAIISDIDNLGRLAYRVSHGERAYRVDPQRHKTLIRESRAYPMATVYPDARLVELIRKVPPKK